MAAISKAILVASSAIAFTASGSIATFSLFDMPELQSQPASRSLPQIRWLFSRGSHIYPSAAFTAASGYLYLAYGALPAGVSLAQALSLAASPQSKVFGFLAAGLLSFGIAPITSFMIPTNFRLIELNEKLGGSRSAESAKVEKKFGQSAQDSVSGKGEAGQFTDLSGPQGKTEKESSKEEDDEVRELMGKFSRLNAMRALSIGLGGVAGLVTALA